MADLVNALGYDVESMNLHRTGRELDIVANHRHERRRAAIECKAQKDPVGGDDINKFVGSLDAERRLHKDIDTVGYFISLSGFRDSAVQQERDLGNERCVMLAGRKISSALESAGVIVSATEALVFASNHCEVSGWKPVGDVSAAMLLATDHGWVWLIKFLASGWQAGYCLVHADGHFLPPSACYALEPHLSEIVQNIRLYVHSSPKHIPADLLASYFSYLRNDCGLVTHEGLPATTQISGGLRLETLYVPLDVEEWRDDRPSDGSGKVGTAAPASRTSIGKALANSRHMSLVGSPGSGKSTLLERIALCYASEADDFVRDASLPEANLFPILVRCRNISSSRPSILEIVKQLPQQFAMPDAEELFASMATDYLRRGNAILLIDGLDEISTTAARSAFVRSVRVLLSTYPQAKVILTSREPGFRPVAEVLADHCVRYRVSDLTPSSITKLVHRWHELVPSKSISEGRSPHELTSKILSVDRLYRLAVNPLLLTTLLLVERWVGDLPKRRTVLYDKAIEVLLYTWNVEGHEPLNVEEALPQLGYVAFEMTRLGAQRLSKKELLQLLRDARRSMPDELAYVKLSPDELIDRIELRSSLLVQAGFDVHDGQLNPTFEFKHLTFQEYLTAVASVRGWNAAGSTTLDSPSVLHEFYGDNTWSEVVPLAVVLAGRAGAHLIREQLEYINHLIDLLFSDSGDANASAATSPNGDMEDRYHNAIFALTGCLLDEPTLSPEVAREALELCIDLGAIERMSNDEVRQILSGKFADILRDIVFVRCTSDRAESESAALAGWIFEFDAMRGSIVDRVEALRRALLSDEKYLKLSGLGLMTSYAYALKQDPELLTHEAERAARAAERHLFLEVLHIFEDDTQASVVTESAAWCLAWILSDMTCKGPLIRRLLDRAVPLLFDPSFSGTKYCSWLIWQNCTAPRSANTEITLTDRQKLLVLDRIPNKKAFSLSHEQKAAITLAYLCELATPERLVVFTDRQSDPGPDEGFYDQLRALLHQNEP